MIRVLCVVDVVNEWCIMVWFEVKIKWCLFWFLFEVKLELFRGGLNFVM